MPEHIASSGWATFWNKGDWWRAIILAVGYIVLFNLASFVVLPLLPGLDPTSWQYVLVVFGIPVLIGGLILIAFGASVGWLRELFARQPIGGSGWMWIAVAAVLLFNILRFATIDYSAAGFPLVATWLLVGLFVGFAEEVLTRGFVVNMMRKAGRPEVAVATVSAAIFAALHSNNLLSGAPLFATLIQLFYTFAFGICMYLALRVTRTLIAPILLHASTDPSIYLQGTYPAPGALATIAGTGNIVVIVVGVVLLIFIRGRVQSVPPPRLG